MICLETVKQYCQDYKKIENYDLAMADNTQTWHCHHRHEIDWALPREELIAIGRYYNVHCSELIFLTPEEHVKLHRIGKVGYWKGKVGYWKDKGKDSPMKGKHHTEETKRKLSDTNTKIHISTEKLYNLYIVQGFTLKQIAKIYRCSSVTIWSKLKKYNISKI